MNSSGAGQQSWTYKETAWLVEGHRQPLYCGAFNHFQPDLLGNLLATVGGHRATVYNCGPGGELDVVQIYVDSDTSEEYYCCAWSVGTETGAPLLLLAGKNGVLLCVNPLTGVLEACLEGHGAPINDVAVHPTRPQLVATASRDQSLRLWNLRTKCCVLVFQGDGGHRNEVLTLSWKPGDDSLLLSAGMDNHIKVWSLAQHERSLAASDEWRPGPKVFPTAHVTMPAFSTERVHWNYVDCVRWLGDFVLSKSVNNSIAVWRPDTSTPQHERDGDVELIQELQLEDCAQVWWLRFALDYWCTVLAIGTNTGRVLLYDPHSPQPHPKARLRPRRGNNKEQRAPLVRQTAVSFDGSIIVACHEDGSITRYDRQSKADGRGSGGPPESQQQQQQQQQQQRRQGSSVGASSLQPGSIGGGEEEEDAEDEDADEAEEEESEHESGS